MNYLAILLTVICSHLAHSAWTAERAFKLQNFGENKCVHFVAVDLGAHALMGDCANGELLLAEPADEEFEYYTIHLQNPDGPKLCLGVQPDISSITPKVVLTSCSLDPTAIWTVENGAGSNSVLIQFGIPLLMTANLRHVEATNAEKNNPNVLWNQIFVVL